jgi:hypothetical protein
VPRKPYRSPRDWLQSEQTRHFGTTRADDLNWHTPQTSLDEALLAAAQQQNNLALHIRANIGHRMPTPALAAFADLHPDTVRDILNGSKHATLAVLHALTSGLGLNLSVATSKAVETTNQGEGPSPVSRNDIPDDVR